MKLPVKETLHTHTTANALLTDTFSSLGLLFRLKQSPLLFLSVETIYDCTNTRAAFTDGPFSAP